MTLTHPVRLVPIVLLTLAFALMNGRFRQWVRALGWKHLVRSRIHFLLLGLLLSRMGFGILQTPVVQSLDALVTLGLGTLGLLLGLSFSLPSDRTGRRLIGVAAIESGATLLLTAVPFYLALDAVSQLTVQQRATAAALVGCAAAISGRRLFGARSSLAPAFQALNRVADLGTIFGIVAAGALLALLSPTMMLSSGEKLLALGATGTLGGVSAWLLVSDMRPGGLRTALLLGVLLLTAGTATHLALPPVVATLLMGLTIARLPGSLASELRQSLAFLESPFRALLLVIAGSALPQQSLGVVALVALFLALRSAGKILGGRIGSAMAPGILPAHAGLGLLPSSAIAVGLALDFRATAPAEISDIIVATTVLGSLLSETMGLWSTWALGRALTLSETAREVVIRATHLENGPTEELP